MLFPDEARTDNVKFRALLIWPFFGLAGLSAGRAPAASAAPSPAPALVFPAQRFRFDAGAPLVAPAGVGLDGTVCVGTVDGYVHALGSDGSYRWSRSVQGAVTHRPLFAGDLWYIATSASRIYALTRAGTLYWVFKPPVEVSSELSADAKGTLYFVGADRFLYGVSAHGGVSLRAALGEPKSGPNVAPDGAIWAENQAGTRIRVRGLEVQRLAPGAKPEFMFPDPEVLRDPEGHSWHGRADGVLELRFAVDASPSLLTLTHSPLFAPAWSTTAHYAVLSSRSGLIFALDPVGVRPGR